MLSDDLLSDRIPATIRDIDNAISALHRVKNDLEKTLSRLDAEFCKTIVEDAKSYKNQWTRDNAREAMRQHSKEYQDSLKGQEETEMKIAAIGSMSCLTAEQQQN